MKTGQSYSEVFSYSQDDVIKFSELSGDKNPIHLDEEYASQTIFKKPVIHGILGISIFSKIMGMTFPGEGTIILKQDISFKRPLFAGDNYEALLTVIETSPERGHILIETKVCDTQTKKINMIGQVLVMNKSKFA
ncbi:MAG: MaoC family dehydratase [Cytophagaceae bacterium]